MEDEPSKETSKKLLEKQLRRQAEEAKKIESHKAARRRNLITGAVVIVVLAAVVFAIQQEKDKEEVAQGVGAAQANCTDIVRPEPGTQDHIEEGASHEPYSSFPPTSGPHYATPADPGFYSDPLVPETVVHNLEHGQIVIWYDPTLTQEELDQIEDITRDQLVATVAVPSAQLEAPYNIVTTAWGAMQSCEEVSEQVINAFRAEFQGRGPEKIPGIEIFQE